MAQNKILVVDDEAGIRLAVGAFLGANEFDVIEADCIKVAEERFIAHSLDAVILDYRLPDGTALDLLPIFKNLDPDVPIVILTAHGSIELAVQALQEGASHFLTKPVEMQALLVILERLLEQSRARRRQIAQRPASALQPLDPFLGSSAAMEELWKEATSAAEAGGPVLITGAAGVGKGVLAKWIHDNSSRGAEALVHVNCAGLTSAFLDAELSGYGWDLFPDARTRCGLFEVANHGTLFLDEIGEVEPAVQSKLLQVINNHTFCRLGEEEERAVDARVIAATSRRLPKAVEDGSFSGDLHACFKGCVLRMKSLKERSEDISRIALALLDRVSLVLGRPGVQLSDNAMKCLEAYAWPGNIRELHNVLERGVLLCSDDMVQSQDLPLGGAAWDGSDSLSTSLSLADVERQHIAAVLAEEAGDQERAAERLGISATALKERIDQHGLER